MTFPTRQQEFDIEIIAQLEGDISDGQKAGLSAFYNSDYHYDILITKDQDGHKVCLRKHVGDIDVVVASRKVDYKGSIRFKIKSNQEWYSLYYEENGEFIELGRGKTALLATEVTHPMTFTGTFLGIFCEKGSISITHASLKDLK